MWEQFLSSFIKLTIILFFIGFILVYGTFKKWEIFVDPPLDKQDPYYLNSSFTIIKKYLGKDVLIASNYFIGVLFMTGGFFFLFKACEK